jgi:20S proteasome alpha/beta subunit
MTYTFKAFIFALLGTTALTAQVSTVYAMGSDREPNTTNMIIQSSTQEFSSTQKNTVFTFSGNAVRNSSIGNETFLAQR